MPLSSSTVRSASCLIDPLRRFIVGAAPFLLLPVIAFAQGSVVEPGPTRTLRVNGAPFYPLGWNYIGPCSPQDAPPGTDQRPAVVEALDTMRRAGLNTVVAAPFSSGRIIPSRLSDDAYTWYPYTFEGVDDKQGSWGHVRPGAYVEGMTWLMDTAHAGGEPLFTIIALSSFFTPGYEGQPYNGGDQLTCPDFQATIDEERRLHAALDPARAARIPRVDCAGQPARAFWEWNVWYVVEALRDHPGLLAWYLWDEPEGAHLRHLFGIVPPDHPIPPYTGPESLPTPDFLRYTYELVKRYETEGRPPSYQRHPIIVDLYQPETFFSNRFSWSRDGALDPNYHSGPFDRRPDGPPQTPADIVGLDASNQMANPGSGEAEDKTLPLLGWWSDQNVVSFRSAAIAEAVEQDNLWNGMAVQVQAQLVTRGPFAIAEPLRCDGNPQLRSRLLNDRDLVWSLLTLQAEGLRGQLYYAHNLLPETGPGAEMERRINRLLVQFQAAGLDRILAAHALPGVASVESVTVEALTNYYRRAPSFVGPIPETFDPGRSTFATAGTPRSLHAYTVATFGRSKAQESFGEPVSPNPLDVAQFADEPLFRTSVRQVDGSTYLFVSNVYDARVRADVRVAAGRNVREGLFDLDASGAFRWVPTPERLDVIDEAQGLALRISMEPYEARVFKLD